METAILIYRDFLRASRIIQPLLFSWSSIDNALSLVKKMLRSEITLGNFSSDGYNIRPPFARFAGERNKRFRGGKREMKWNETKEFR